MGSNPILASIIDMSNIFLNKSFNKKKILLIMLVLAFFLIFFAKTFFIKGYNIIIDGSKGKQTLQIATSPDFPPFEFVKKNKIVGIDVDIINAISKETGIRFEWNNMAFNAIIAGLTSKKIDIAISGINATPERAKNVDFTDEYFRADLALIVKKDKKLQSLRSFIGKNIGAQTGSTMQKYLENYNTSLSGEDGKINIVTIDDNNVGVEMLLNGKIDAFLLEDLQGKVYAKMYDDVTFISIKTRDRGLSYNIALQKKSPFTKVINEALSKIKKDGTVDKIVKKWEEKYISQTIKEIKHKEYIKSLIFILKGTFVTVQYAIISILCGLIFALFWVLLMYSGSRILFFLSRAYVSIIRGTPLLLQMSFVYFGLSKILGVNLSVFTSAVIALSFNSAGYVIEIIRSGIRAIDAGQFDACKSLNLSKYQAIKDIYIPQVVHNIFPALINEFISIIKESSIVSIFGGFEIMKRTNLVIAEYYSYFTPLVVAGLSYYIMTFSLELLAHWWEKRYKY